jgi:hypothetical protein
MFRGDCVHAGGDYHGNDNLRLHVYLDCSTFERVPNSTHLAALRRHVYPYLVLPMYLEGGAGECRYCGGVILRRE